MRCFELQSYLMILELNSGSGRIAFPDIGSKDGNISKTDKVVAILIHSKSSAKWRPGHTLRSDTSETTKTLQGQVDRYIPPPEPEHNLRRVWDKVR